MQIVLLTIIWLALMGGDHVLATAQMPDYLIYEDKKYPLFSNPLEDYYQAGRQPRPPFQAWHTANYRGYVATWEIKDDTLYLKDIRAKIGGRMVGLDYLFPDNPGRLAATWFRGVLRIPLGEVLRRVHQGYATVYEQELKITIQDGKVVRKDIINNRSRSGPEQ
jgi:hypothetical protein